MAKMVLKVKGWKRPDQDALVGIQYGRYGTVFFSDPGNGPLQEVDVRLTLEEVGPSRPRFPAWVVDEDDGYCD